MNPSNSTEADQGLLPTSSTHPGSKGGGGHGEPMSNDDEGSDSDVSFDEDDDDCDDALTGGANTSSHSINADDLEVQLASAGPTGVAAAAAISSTKKRKSDLCEMQLCINSNLSQRYD